MMSAALSMLVSAFHVLVLLLSILSFAGMAIRVLVLSWGTHQWPVVGMHAALLIACGNSLLACARWQAGIPEIAVPVGAFCWLWYSWPTWGLGFTPPKYTESSSSDFDDKPHHHHKSRTGGRLAVALVVMFGVTLAIASV